MTFFARLRILVGVVGVLLVCGALFLFLEYSMTRVAAKESYIDSDSYTVGLDYSGVVDGQYKKQGDTVKAGDVLFEIRSATLSDAIRNNEVAAAKLLYSVNDKGLVVITAAANGQVRTINYSKGAFVPANETLAIIDLQNGTYIRSTYKLSAPDYAKLGNNSRVEAMLPDGTKVSGGVYDITFATVDKQVLTSVKTRINISDTNHRLFSSGTPVNSTLSINNDSLFAKLMQAVYKAMGR